MPAKCVKKAVTKTNIAESVKSLQFSLKPKFEEFKVFVNKVEKHLINFGRGRKVLEMKQEKIVRQFVEYVECYEYLQGATIENIDLIEVGVPDGSTHDFPEIKSGQIRVVLIFKQKGFLFWNVGGEKITTIQSCGFSFPKNLSTITVNANKTNSDSRVENCPSFFVIITATLTGDGALLDAASKMMNASGENPEKILAKASEAIKTKTAAAQQNTAPHSAVPHAERLIPI